MTDVSFDDIEDEWRTKPADLGKWANRATQMERRARRYHTALDTIVRTTKIGGAADIAREALRER